MFGSATTARADADSASRPLVFDGSPATPFATRVGVGLSVDLLPLRVVESELRAFPHALGYLRVALPHGFSAEARASAVVLYNDFELGAAWSWRTGSTAFQISHRIGVWLGLVPLTGFNTTGWGFTQSPSLSASFALGGSRITLRASLYITHPQHVRFGSGRVVLDTTRFAGESIALVVESPVFATGAIYYALTLYYTTFDAQAWLAFSDFPERVLFPSFAVGYEF